jgi:mRNA interferase HigB
MQIIAKSRLRDFWERHPQARKPLSEWYRLVNAARWDTPSDVKVLFGAAVDFVGDNRIIFDIAGNKYRLVVHVAYPYQRVLIKFVGSHADYDRINVETIS